MEGEMKRERDRWGGGGESGSCLGMLITLRSVSVSSHSIFISHEDDARF